MNNWRTTLRFLKLPLILGAWMVVLGGGFLKLLTYSNTPGESAKAFQQWPAQSTLARPSHFPILVAFLHPHCPCSEATVGELARLMPHIKGKMKVLAVFFKPQTQSKEWAIGRLWQMAQNIPGVEILLDEGGLEAAQFDAKTSGQTFLFDSSGKLVFNGGITSARGHMGDSVGRDTIIAFAETGKILTPKTSVFGCSLKNPAKSLSENPDRNPAKNLERTLPEGQRTY